jgi:cysteine-rich repeat protein
MVKKESKLLFLLIFAMVFVSLGFASALYCGDGISDIGEECDDGNNVSGDGCSNNCIFEFCGDVICNNYETVLTCPCDCGNCPLPPICGDGTCNGDETCETCPGDCGECECEDECCECSQTCFTCPIRCENYTFNYTDNNEKEKTIKSNHFVQFCDPNWVCSGWGECANGAMHRKCTDDNNCKQAYNKPIEETGCTGNVLSEDSGNGTVKYFWFWMVLGIILFIILLVILVNLM